MLCLKPSPDWPTSSRMPAPPSSRWRRGELRAGQATLTSQMNPSMSSSSLPHPPPAVLDTQPRVTPTHQRVCRRRRPRRTATGRKLRPQGWSSGDPSRPRRAVGIPEPGCVAAVLAETLPVCAPGPRPCWLHSQPLQGISAGTS